MQIYVSVFLSLILSHYENKTKPRMIEQQLICKPADRRANSVIFSPNQVDYNKIIFNWQNSSSILNQETYARIKFLPRCDRSVN